MRHRESTLVPGMRQSPTSSSPIRTGEMRTDPIRYGPDWLQRAAVAIVPGLAQDPAQAGGIAADARAHGHRRTLARPDPEGEFHRRVCRRGAVACDKEACAVLAHEDAERLADQEPLADIEELRGRPVRLENRRIGPCHEIDVGHFVE